MGSIEQSILTKMQQGFEPSVLEVVNESHMHSVPANSETHFKILIVSEKFEGLSRIDRHREVQGLLTEELAGELHAINLRLMTPVQYEATQAVHSSPGCASKLES